MRVSVSENQIAFDFSVTDLPQSAPYRKSSATSRKAAEKVGLRLIKMHREVVRLLAKYPNVTPDDLCDTDYGIACGWYEVTIRARCCQLQKAGYLRISGEGTSRRNNPQNRYTLTEKGYQLAKQLSEQGK